MSRRSSSTHEQIVRGEAQDLASKEHDLVHDDDQIESEYTLAMVLLQRGYRVAEVAELTKLSLDEVLALYGS